MTRQIEHINHVYQRHKSIDETIREFELKYKKLKHIPLESEMSPEARLTIYLTYSSYFDFLRIMDELSIFLRQNAKEAITNHGLMENADVLKEIKYLSKKMNYPPHPDDYARSKEAIEDFGSWYNALQCAGVQVTLLYQTVVSKEELAYKGKKLADSLGRLPTIGELKKAKLSPKLIELYFKSFFNFSVKIGYRNPRSTITLRDAQIIDGIFKFQKTYQGDSPHIISSFAKQSSFSDKVIRTTLKKNKITLDMVKKGIKPIY